MIDLKKDIYDNYKTQSTRKYGKFTGTGSNAFDKWVKVVYRIVKDWLPADLNSNILDLGTGGGNFLYLLNKKGYKNLHGVDISQEQVELAKKMIPSANITKDDLMNYLMNNKKKFDLISGFDVIEHFTKEQAYILLKLAYESLNTEGIIILQTPNAASPWMGNVSYGDLTHEWFYTPGSLEDLLFQCGFNKYEPKKNEPNIRGTKSFIRRILWEFLNLAYRVINLIETGGEKYMIYSRVFIASASKSG